MHKLGMVTNLWNPSTGEVEAKGSEIPGHPQLHSEFKARLELSYDDVVSHSPSMPPFFPEPTTPRTTPGPPPAYSLSPLWLLSGFLVSE